MHQEVHNCSRGVSIKNYEPCIEKSDWSIQIIVVEVKLMPEKICSHTVHDGSTKREIFFN